LIVSARCARNAPKRWGCAATSLSGDADYAARYLDTLNVV
jgi:hypothetical protein